MTGNGQRRGSSTFIAITNREDTTSAPGGKVKRSGGLGKLELWIPAPPGINRGRCGFVHFHAAPRLGSINRIPDNLVRIGAVVEETHGRDKEQVTVPDGISGTRSDFFQLPKASQFSSSTVISISLPAVSLFLIDLLIDVLFRKILRESKMKLNHVNIAVAIVWMWMSLGTPSPLQKQIPSIL
jgi:hypothetical protein